MSVDLQAVLEGHPEPVQEVPLLPEGTTLMTPGRCFACRRILFPDADGKIPYHRVPAEVTRTRVSNRGQFGSVPLTGQDADWCRGGGTRAVA